MEAAIWIGFRVTRMLHIFQVNVSCEWGCAPEQGHCARHEHMYRGVIYFERATHLEYIFSFGWMSLNILNLYLFWPSHQRELLITGPVQSLHSY